MNEIKTECINPSIPMRQYDWMAWRDGNEEFGPVAYGPTEALAIAELLAAEMLD
jgi:hypothetical protein